MISKNSARWTGHAAGLNASMISYDFDGRESLRGKKLALTRAPGIIPTAKLGFPPTILQG